MIHVTDAREIALHEFFPLLIIRHPLVPTLSAVAVRVLHVVLKMLRKLDLIQRIKIEPALGHLPRDVRTEEAHREKQRLVARLFHLFDCPVRDKVVAVALLRLRQWCRTKQLAAGVPAKRTALGQTGIHIRHQFRPWPIGRNRVVGIAAIIVPRLGIIL